jgi:hypothetical protein
MDETDSQSLICYLRKGGVLNRRFLKGKRFFNKRSLFLKN